MKRIVLLAILVLPVVLAVLIIACEKHKDPFSAQNSAPLIKSFVFKPDRNLPDPSLRADGDSLKFKAGEAYPIELVYEDAQAKNSNRTLRATFKFLAGSGRISSNKFANPSSDGLSFDVPAQFTANDEIRLIPEKPGIIDLQLTISDGVKNSETKTASTTFFENLPPVVSFEPVPDSDPDPPYGIKFDASKSFDRDGTIKTYTWSFGDGENEVTESNTTPHNYQKSGIFTVRLKVTDNEGAVDSLDKVVTTVNQPPVAVLSVDPTSGKAPLLIKYNARNSRDRDGSIVAYDISFGDGQSSQSDSGSHRYTSDSNYSVRLTVRDNLGASNTTTVPVMVATPPIAVLKALPDSGAFPLSVMLDGSGSYDPQGGRIVNPQIAINDQSSTTYKQLSVIHIFRSPGDFRVALQVGTDRNSALSGEDQKVVRAFNTAPVADFTWVRDLGNVTFTSTSFDPNAPDDRIVNYSWNFGDNTAEQSGATLSTVTHTYARSGNYVVRLTVTDNVIPPLMGVKQDTVEVR
jgi:PKD repeat protein